MAYFMTTPLGRSVPLNDWRSFHADTIAKVLYGASTSPFNPNDDAIPIAALMHPTGLALPDVQELCLMLEQGGIVQLERDGRGVPVGVRLTERGRTWVGFKLGGADVAVGR